MNFDVADITLSSVSGDHIAGEFLYEPDGTWYRLRIYDDDGYLIYEEAPYP